MIKWANLWNYHSIYKQLKLALHWNKRYTLWSWCKSTCIILVWIWTCRRHDIIDIDCTAFYTIQINLTQFSYTHSMFGSTHTIIEVCFSIIKNILTLIWGVLVCPVAKWQDGNQANCPPKWKSIRSNKSAILFLPLCWSWNGCGKHKYKLYCNHYYLVYISFL